MLTTTIPASRAALCAGLLALALPAAAVHAAPAKAPSLEEARKLMGGQWTGYQEPRPAGAPRPPVSVINDRRFPPALEAIMKPWVKAGYEKYKDAAIHVVDKEPPTPDNHCLPFAIPGEGASSGFGLQIEFTPKVVGFIIQLDTQFRLIRMNAQHPKNLTPSFHGDSIGRWEGDTLVVDSVGFDTRSQFSDGVLHSEKLHIVERYHVNPQGILEAQITYTDPDAYTGPYTQTRRWKRIGNPPQEYLNAQNNQLYACPNVRTGSDYHPFR
jgi:hypothetical protein